MQEDKLWSMGWGAGKDVGGKAFGLFQNLMGEILGEFQLGRNTTLAC